MELRRHNPKFIIHHAATSAGRLIETEVQRSRGSLIATPYDWKPASHVYVQICNSEFDHVSSDKGNLRLALHRNGNNGVTFPMPPMPLFSSPGGSTSCAKIVRD